MKTKDILLEIIVINILILVLLVLYTEPSIDYSINSSDNADKDLVMYTDNYSVVELIGNYPQSNFIRPIDSGKGNVFAVDEGIIKSNVMWILLETEISQTGSNYIILWTK